MNGLKRTLLASAFDALVCTALLLALPWGMVLGLQSWLDEANAGEVEIENIDFNPFTGVAILEQLHIAIATGSSLVLPKISLDENGDISLQGLSLQDTRFGDELTDGADDPDESAAPVPSASLISTDQVNIVGGNKISIGTLEWRDVVSVGRREEDGDWRILRILETQPFAEPSDSSQ
jgi:hypothetical protein